MQNMQVVSYSRLNNYSKTLSALKPRGKRNALREGVREILGMGFAVIGEGMIKE